VAAADEGDVTAMRHLEDRERFHQECVRRIEAAESAIVIGCRFDQIADFTLMCPKDLQESETFIDGRPSEVVRACELGLGAAQQIVEQCRAITTRKQRVP
jgi:hypothetical protein